MKVKMIEPRANAPEKLLVNVELSAFIQGAPNIKMVDIAIWSGDKGPWVAFPGRQFTGQDGKKKTARFIRAVGDEWDDYNRLCEFILSEYRKWAASQPDNDGPGGDEGPDDNPFA